MTVAPNCGEGRRNTCEISAIQQNAISYNLAAGKGIELDFVSDRAPAILLFKTPAFTCPARSRGNHSPTPQPLSLTGKSTAF